MLKILVTVSMALVVCFSQKVMAEDGHDHGKDKKWHCEKTVDGKTTDLKDVTDRKECKKQGGKWKKGHDHGEKGEKDHKEGDGHDHG